MEEGRRRRRRTVEKGDRGAAKWRMEMRICITLSWFFYLYGVRILSFWDHTVDSLVNHRLLFVKLFGEVFGK